MLTIARQLQYEEEVKDDIQHVLKHGGSIKKEVAGKDGRWFMLELRPHAPEDEKDGAVITFVDITEIKETELELAEKVEKIKELQRQIITNDISDRWRIGQFLHDDLGQTLISAKVLLQNAKNKLGNGEKIVAEDIDQVVDILSTSTTEIRELSHEVVPVDIQEKGLRHAFNNFCHQLENLQDIHCELELDDTVENLTNREIATHLYRIVKEAAKNAAVHGNANNVKVTLKSDKDYLYLTIEDDGTGFSESSKEQGGMGISIMRHRLELMGGTLEILDTSDLGSDGATISCRLPIDEI